MLQPIALVLVPPGLIIAGTVILLGQYGGSFEGRAAQPDRLATIISAIGWVLLLLGLFAAVGLMTHVLFPVAWIVMAVVLLSLKYRFRAAERRALLWMLMLAAERRIPLETAARAFAEERNDEIGNRALDLAAYLEAGLPLALALRRSRLAFPHAVLLAAELGQQTDNLGEALRQALGSADESEVILRSTMERAFYLAFLVLYNLAVWGFLMLKIVPVFEKIFRDFEAELPAVTVGVISLAHGFVIYWPFLLLLGAFLLSILFRFLSYYTGFSPRYLPGLNPSWHRADRTVIMRWLALAVRRNRPLPEMLRLVAGYLSQRGLRDKVRVAAGQIQQGADWTECLRRTGLIRAAEVAVFRSAERAGNLPWALEEMADSSQRRSIYRLRVFVNAAFPAALIAMGGSVLLATFGILAPLVKLIQGLA